MIHAYCVRWAGEPPPGAGLEGLGGAPVGLLEEDALGLWISETPAATATPERLREHDRVVRHALRTSTPLPIRYGAGAFPSEAAAREALVERAAELAESLARVAGHVEMGVRIDWDPPGPPVSGTREPRSAGGGRAYLEARREALREREALLNAAAAALDRVEREMGLDHVPSARTMLPGPGTAGIVAHLVRRTDAGRYGRAVAAAREALPEYRITPSGPWAPYSFS